MEQGIQTPSNFVFLVNSFKKLHFLINVSSANDLLNCKSVKGITQFLLWFT